MRYIYNVFLALLHQTATGWVEHSKSYIQGYSWFKFGTHVFSFWFVLQVHKFLDKNFDMVRQDVLDLFIQSKNRVRYWNFSL